MGVIRKQTIVGTLYTYLGAGLGVFTNLILLAWFFSPEQIGLLNVLVAYSLLFAQLANLGFDYVTNRLFPYFRDPQSQHHGYFALLVRVLLFGVIISSLIFIFMFPLLAKNDSGNKLFSLYGWYILPLTFFTLFFNSLDAFSRILYKSIRGTFLKEVLQRIFIILVIGAYILWTFSFNYFVLLYVISLSIPTIIIFILLYKENELSFRVEKGFVNKKLKKEIWSVSIFGIITIFSSSVVINIDKIMIQQYLDLTQTGLYAIASFFGVIITMPSRALSKISATVVAEAWKENDTSTINTIYYKSCINQLVFSLILFVGIWVNIDNILLLLPAKYAHIQWVIFWIAMGSFIDMSTGINSTIIGTSPYYKMQTLFMIIFVGIIIFTNAIFIPMYGIEGAAFASALSLFVFNLIRWLFLLLKYKMQPFNDKFILTIAIGLLAYYIAYKIPALNQFYYDIILRSLVVLIIYVPAIYFFKISDDINSRINVYYEKIRLYFNRKYK